MNHNSTKSILLKPRFSGWTLHTLYSELINCPPPGFKIFYDRKNTTDSLHNLDNKSTFPPLKELFFHLKPIPYLLAQRMQKNDFSGYDLVYASQHVLFDTDRPWIVDCEFANALAAYGNISLIKKSIQHALEKKDCKFILPWSEWAKQTLMLSLDCTKISAKIRVVHYTVRPKKFVKLKHNEIVLLFVGSANPMNQYNIQFKNLREVIVAFDHINKKYDNLQLVIRSFLTPDLKRMVSKNPKIMVIDRLLNEKELHDLYINSDIFVLPSHETMGISLLDAMSFGLSVISMNIYDIPEVITHQKNGLLLEPPTGMKYYSSTLSPLDYKREFTQTMRQYSNVIIHQLEEFFILLIEDDNLRTKLGEEAKKTIDSGLFSVESRNKTLKEIFESAL